MKLTHSFYVISISACRSLSYNFNVFNSKFSRAKTSALIFIITYTINVILISYREKTPKAFKLFKVRKLKWTLKLLTLEQIF